MTRIKLCGLSRPCDIEAANLLKPDYVGFVFAPKSKRCVTSRQAGELKRLLAPGILAVGVFVDEVPETIASLLNAGVIDMAQLHGGEGESDIRRLRSLTHRPIVQAFRIQTAQDVAAAQRTSADYLLVDSGAGTGTTFDWNLVSGLARPYFLAGGLDPGNVAQAVNRLHPFAVDVSSGIESDGRKDPEKMAAFVAAVRKEDRP